MDYPVVKIQSNARHLGKMRRGHKCRMVAGGSLPVALHPLNYARVVKAFSKGKGIHMALSPDEIHQNRGRGLWDDFVSGATDFGNSIVSGATDLGNDINNKVIQPVIKNAPDIADQTGRFIMPYAKQLGNLAIDEGVKALPMALGAAGAAAATMSGNPEFAGMANDLGNKLGTAAAGPLGDLAHSGWNSVDPYHTNVTANAPPSRQPQTSYLNEMTGQNMGTLDRANMGSYLANMGLAQLEGLVAEKRRTLGMPHFDYSGDKSLSQYADAVPPTGAGLYGGMHGGHGLYGGMHGDGIHNPRKHLIASSRRREVGSIGRQGNLLGNEPPALESQSLSANYQWNSFLPPQFHTK